MYMHIVISVIMLIVVGVSIYFLFGVSNVEAPTHIDKSTPSDAKDEIHKEPGLPVQSGDSVEVYDGIKVSGGTRILDLSGRGLTGSLKAEVRLLSQLETLDLSGNNFTGLPAEVGQLSKLRVLNLSNNPLTGLPHELGNLQNLETFDLRGTQYSTNDLDIIKQNLPTGVIILTE